MNKRATLPLIAILTLSSLLIVRAAPASAAVSKPSVPEFTLQIVARPFDVPPETTVNQYTGQTVITRGGYHVENKSVDITIKNQPPYTSNYVDGISVWYQVRFKGPYRTQWTTYLNDNRVTPIECTKYNHQRIGDYTVISIPINSDEPLTHVGSVTNFPEGGEVEFQVRAMIGSINVIPHGGPGFSDWVEFNGEKSEWSNTQTIKIGESQTSTTSPTTAPAATPTATSTFSTSATVQLTFGGVFLVLTWAQITIALIIAVAILLVIIAVLVHKTTTKKAPNAT